MGLCIYYLLGDYLFIFAACDLCNPWIHLYNVLILQNKKTSNTRIR